MVGRLSDLGVDVLEALEALGEAEALVDVRVGREAERAVAGLLKALGEQTHVARQRITGDRHTVHVDVLAGHQGRDRSQGVGRRRRHVLEQHALACEPLEEWRGRLPVAVGRHLQRRRRVDQGDEDVGLLERAGGQLWL